jgi:hypothetical protein
VTALFLRRVPCPPHRPCSSSTHSFLATSFTVAPTRVTLWRCDADHVPETAYMYVLISRYLIVLSCSLRDIIPDFLVDSEDQNGAACDNDITHSVILSQNLQRTSNLSTVQFNNESKLS